MVEVGVRGGVVVEGTAGKLGRLVTPLQVGICRRGTRIASEVSCGKSWLFNQLEPYFYLWQSYTGQVAAFFFLGRL